MLKTPVVMLLFVSACGFQPVAEQVDQPESTQKQAPLNPVGHYVYGPQVQKGFAGTPGPLADLEVKADFTFEMLYGEGCVLQGTTGTWSADATSVYFSLSRTDWTDASGARHSVSTLTAQPQGSGLIVVGTTSTGVALSQAWTKQ